MIFVSNSISTQKILGLVGIVLLFAACSSVKEFPINKPFVFSNTITLKNNVGKDEKKRLTLELDNYWDDSLKARKVQQFGFIYKLKKPPVYDSVNISRSRGFMNAFLNSQGYYYATFKDSVRIDTVTVRVKKAGLFHTLNVFERGEPVKQQRANIAFTIDAGKRITIDSVGFAMIYTLHKPIDSTLQNITLAQAKYSLLKKGKPYSKQIVSDELDRLAYLYRSNGYYNLNREDIYALADTLNAKLLTLSIDPLAQAQLINEAANARKEDPKWRFTMMLKKVTDTLKLKQYYVGNLYYYPDIKNVYYNADTLMARKDYKESFHKSGVMRFDEDKFRFRPLREHTYLIRGGLYNENAYYKSINKLNQIGSWKQVDAKAVVRPNSDSIDFHFFLLPAPKQSWGIDFEGSRNTGDIGSGNLLGLATNLTYKNRNVWKQAIQSLTQARFGFEFNIDKQVANAAPKPLVQTQQFTVSHSYSFPRIIQPFKNWKWLTGQINKLDNKKTIFSAQGSYTNRIDFYQLRSLNLNFGFDYTKGNVDTVSFS